MRTPLALLLLSYSMPFAVLAEEANVIENNSIEVFLTNDRGDPQTTFFFDPGQTAPGEVVFRHRVRPSQIQYTSWVLEITEPKNSLLYRMAFEGQLPFLIHWDGMFDNDRGMVPNQRYFIRLLLITSDKKVYGSPYSFFSTSERQIEAGGQVEMVQVAAVKLFVQLSGGLKTIRAITPSYSSSLFPNLDGDLGVYWKDDHRFGVRFDVTSNILSGWNLDVSGNILRYSDLSLSYRYRLAGEPPKRPLLPYVPPYLKGGRVVTSYDSSVFGAPFNCEIGFRIYNTVAAGSDAQAITNELPGQTRGIATTLHTDFTFYAYRFFTVLEAGISAFGGNLRRIGFEGAAVYDHWQSIAPGLIVSYTSFGGLPDPKGGSAGTSISTTLLTMGAYLVFKV